MERCAIRIREREAVQDNLYPVVSASHPSSTFFAHQVLLQVKVASMKQRTDCHLDIVLYAHYHQTHATQEEVPHFHLFLVKSGRA